MMFLFYIFYYHMFLIKIANYKAILSILLQHSTMLFEILNGIK